MELYSLLKFYVEGQTLFDLLEIRYLLVVQFIIKDKNFRPQ